VGPETSIRRFAPPRGFLCDALYVEFAGDRPGVWVYRDGSRVAIHKVSLLRALRRVRTGLWVELPQPPAR
jgi:hypothetical protein